MHKPGRKSRNIITGILIGGASIFAVAYFLDLPGDLLTGFFLSALLFVFIIIILAISALFIYKGVGKLSAKIAKNSQEPEDKRE